MYKMHVSLISILMQNTGHTGASSLWGIQYLSSCWITSTVSCSFQIVKLSTEHRLCFNHHGKVIILPKGPKTLRFGLKYLRLLICQIHFVFSDMFHRFSHSCCISFNNGRGFYSVLVHREHRCPVLDFRGWMKDSPKQMGSMCTRSAQPARLPFGQQNCPVMDSCAQGRANRKWNHTQYLWAPPGSGDSLTWATHSRQTERKFLTRSTTIHNTFIKHSRSTCTWRSG